MKKIIIVLLILTLSCYYSYQQVPPQAPVIGIFTQTYDQDIEQTYIAASYVKFIEMSGAQVVPIYSFSQPSSVLALLQKINGVLFTGGSMNFNISDRWTQNADLIFKFAVQQNKKGNPFPLYGTCMGFQLFAYLTSKYNDTILTRVHGDQNIVLPLNMVEEGNLYDGLNDRQLNKLTKGYGVMLFNHNWAVTMETFNTNSYLKPFWKLTATATTPFNQQFVASYEAKDYPFYATQYHPEKSNFEWKVSADRSREAIQVVSILSNNFVEVARRNKNNYNPQQLKKDLIYNFSPKEDQYFTQIYFFKEPSTIKIIQ